MNGVTMAQRVRPKGPDGRAGRGGTEGRAGVVVMSAVSAEQTVQVHLDLLGVKVKQS
ncbi:hypothetical protein GCM10010327_22000 [Streptomyces nitrosporeus]|nr:hypothetical protein GCM10010327_22000 [Streptomyces nitrosporeus]